MLKILKTLELILPAIIPSWRFFDIIAPSPRIEFAQLKSATDTPDNWQKFRPKPAHIPARTMLKRMFFNPKSNETLFLVSCAERLLQNPTQHSAQEILKRITTDLKRSGTDITKTPYLQFRIAFISREGETLNKYIAFTSPIHTIAEGTQQ